MIDPVPTERCVLALDAPIDPFERLRLRVGRGELVLACCADSDHADQIVRLAVGMELPPDGEARFIDADWSATKPDRASMLRSRIGLVRSRLAWVDHLTVLQNLMLVPLHHGTRGRRRAIADEAAVACRAMGLPGAPVGRPDDVPRDELERASIARAFIGDRRLVILEDPPEELVVPIINNIRDFCRGGGAALWLCTDRNYFSHPPFSARRIRLDESSSEAVA